uniref:BLTX532 n=1 Tax=Nephila pilipes TaxID=299642 RepID=A0A076KZU4_NEPPI|nr:BLTX532 [Nephila pilipes]
MGASCPRP